MTNNQQLHIILILLVLGFIISLLNIQFFKKTKPVTKQMVNPENRSAGFLIYEGQK